MNDNTENNESKLNLIETQICEIQKIKLHDLDKMRENRINHLYFSNNFNKNPNHKED